MYTSKLIGWIVSLVFVSVLSSICIIGEWISRPEKSYYAECMSQMNRLVEIFGIDPTKYVGMESRDIHARLIEEYRKEYSPEIMKDFPCPLELSEDGHILDSWRTPLQIQIEEHVREGGLVYKIRISSAGKDGVFDSLNNDDVVIEEACSVRSAPESGCWQDGAQPFQ